MASAFGEESELEGAGFAFFVLALEAEAASSSGLRFGAILLEITTWRDLEEVNALTGDESDL